MPHKWSFCFFIDLFVSHSWKGTIFSPTWLPASTSRCWRSFERPSSPQTSPSTSTTTTSCRRCWPHVRWIWTTIPTGQATTHTGAQVRSGPHQVSSVSRCEMLDLAHINSTLSPSPPRMDITRLCSPPGTVWLVWWWQHVTCVLLPSSGKSHDSQPTTSMLSFGLRYSGILLDFKQFQCHDYASSVTVWPLLLLINAASTYNL